MDVLVPYFLGFTTAMGLGMMLHAALQMDLRLRLDDMTYSRDKWAANAEKWRWVAALPDELEHRQPLTEEELERRHGRVINDPDVQENKVI